MATYGAITSAAILLHYVNISVSVTKELVLIDRTGDDKRTQNYVAQTTKNLCHAKLYRQPDSN